MKKIFRSVLFVLCASLFMFGWCKKHSSHPNNNVMTATIGTAQFNSKGGDVNVNITGPELTITGESGNQVLTIAVANYTGNGTYHFNNGEALGGYDNGGGTGDDAITSGTVVITQSGSTIAGTFSCATQGGTSISNGSFSVQHP